MRKSGVGRSGKKRVGKEERYLTSGTLASGSPAWKVGHESSIARGTPTSTSSSSSSFSFSHSLSRPERLARWRVQSAGPILSNSFFWYFSPIIRSCCPSSSLEPRFATKESSAGGLLAQNASRGRKSWEALPCYYARRQVRHRLSIVRYIGNEFRNGGPSIITAGSTAWRKVRGCAPALPGAANARSFCTYSLKKSLDSRSIIAFLPPPPPPRLS